MYSEVLYGREVYGLEIAHKIIAEIVAKYKDHYSSHAPPGLLTLSVNPDHDTHYYKSACVVNELRRILGFENLRAILKHFVSKYKGDSISVEKLNKAIVECCGQDMSWFFAQWLNRWDLPEIHLSYDQPGKNNHGDWTIEGVLVQNREPFTMPIELMLQVRDGKDVSRQIWMSK